MPLFAVSPNIQEPEGVSRRRFHDDFVDTDPPSGSENSPRQKFSGMTFSNSKRQTKLTPAILPQTDSIPGSSPAGLSESRSSPVAGSPSPTATPSKSLVPQAGTPPPPETSAMRGPTAPASKPAKSVKRKPKTVEKAAEQEAKRRKKEETDASKAKAAAVREAAKTAKAAEKARLDEEKAERKRAKDAEVEAKKKQKEEAELAVKRKNERQQSLLAAFVKKETPTTPSKKTASPIDRGSPAPTKQDLEPSKSAYETLFKPFFVHQWVTLPPSSFEMDTEARETKSRILDEYIRGERDNFNPTPFNAEETFQLAFPPKRGVLTRSVKNIMEPIHGNSYDAAFNLVPSKTDAQLEKLKTAAQSRIGAIPMKYLAFYEDHRPPYFGTATADLTAPNLRKLTRRPMGRVLELDYEFDSEAEWDGMSEDLNDLDDDEDDDVDEEMEEFLDDSEDVPRVASHLRSDGDPISTGICFEDRKRMGPCATTYKYRLQFLLDTLEHHSLIDPFSTEYWPTTKKSAPISTLLPPTTATSGPISAATPGSVKAAPLSKDLVAENILAEFKQAITSEDFSSFSKVTMIELLMKRFPSCSKLQVRTTLDQVAHRTKSSRKDPNTGKKEMVWVLK